MWILTIQTVHILPSTSINSFYNYFKGKYSNLKYICIFIWFLADMYGHIQKNMSQGHIRTEESPELVWLKLKPQGLNGGQGQHCK